MDRRSISFIAVQVSFLLIWPVSAPAQTATASQMLLQARFTETVLGNIAEAIRLYEQIPELYPEQEYVAAEALLRLAQCLEKTSDPKAITVYERLILQYPQQGRFFRTATERYSALLGTRSNSTIDVLGRRKIRDLGPGDCSPSLSSDGRSLVTVDPGSGDLFLTELPDGEITRLTWAEGLRPGGSGAYALAPSISDDGSRVAFTWINGGEDTITLRACDRSGTILRVWTADDNWSYLQAGAWRPDERSFFGFRTKDDNGESQLVEYALDSDTPIPLRRIPGGPPQSIRYIPKLQSIVFDTAEAEREYWSSTILAPLSDSTYYWIGDDPAEDHLLTIDPDGRYTVLLSRRTQPQAIWVVGNEPVSMRLGVTRILDLPGLIVPLCTTVDRAFHYTVEEGMLESQPDPDWVGIPALWTLRWGEYRAEEELGSGHLDFGSVDPMGFSRAGAYLHAARFSDYELHVGTTSLQRAIPDSGSVLLSAFYRRQAVAAFAPSGVRIAFVASPSTPRWFDNAPPIVVRNLDTGEMTRIPISVDIESDLLIWEPDETGIIVFGLDAGGREGLFRIDLERRSKELILPSGSEQFLAPVPDYTRSGFYFLTNDLMSGSARAVFMEWSNHFVRTIASLQGRLAGPLALSPDGSELICLTSTLDRAGPDTVWRMVRLNTRDGAITPMSVISGERVLEIAWSSTGDRIRIVSQRTRPNSSIEETELRVRELKPDGSQVSSRYESAPAFLGSLQRNPSGQGVIYTMRRKDRSSSLWKMERLFDYVNSILER
jgi:hypothetical protein